jgi:hypothetical protein
MYVSRFSASISTKIANIIADDIGSFFANGLSEMCQAWITGFGAGSFSTGKAHAGVSEGAYVGM